MKQLEMNTTKQMKRVQRVVTLIVIALLFLFVNDPVLAAGFTIDPVKKIALQVISGVIAVFAVTEAFKAWSNGSMVKMIISILAGMFLFFFASSPETVLEAGQTIFGGMFGGN